MHHLAEVMWWSKVVVEHVRTHPLNDLIKHEFIDLVILLARLCTSKHSQCHVFSALPLPNDAC